MKPEKWSLPKVSGEWIDAPIADVLLDLADQCGVSVVPPPGEPVAVSLAFTDVDGQVAFTAVGERLGLTALYRDGVVAFSPVPASVLFLMDPGFESPDDLAEVLRGVIGAGGVVRRVGQRVAVVADPGLSERLEQIEGQLRTGADGWEVSVVVFQVTRGFAWSLGVGATAGGRASLGVNLDSDPLPDATPVGARFVAAVDALFEASESRRDAQVLTHGSLFVLEGSRARMQQGEVVPVPQRTVSDQGTVTVVGFDNVESGFSLEVESRRVPGGVVLNLTPTLSSINGYVEDRPILAQRSVTASAIFRSGDWLVMSGLDSLVVSADRAGMPGVSWLQSNRKSEDRSTLVLAVRAVRVYAAGSL